jgi:restriction system protein
MTVLRAWIVRSPEEIANDVEGKSTVAIGGKSSGDLNQYKSVVEIRQKYGDSNPNWSKAHIRAWCGQLWRFSHDIQQGDYVLTPLKATREVLFGIVNSDYVYDPMAISANYPNIRTVTWKKKISRDDLSQSFRNTIGGLLTVFNLDNLLPDIEAIITSTKVAQESKEKVEDLVPYHEEVQSKADEMISDILSNMDPYEFQHLVANLLKAMGFNVKVGPEGADGGVDILAYPDAFGFKSPRIKVQVKLRKGSAGAPEIQQLAGAAGQDEAMFVSLGGFTQQAQNESKKHSKLVLVDRDRLVELLLEYYEKLDPEYRTLIPLKKIYVPTKTV